MRAASFTVVFLSLSASIVGQSVCLQPTSQLLEHRPGFKIYGVTLPSTHGVIKATAAIPDSRKPSRATVFSFSRLVGSEPQQRVNMKPLAAELSKQGWTTLVIERQLTWPDVDPSVGTMRMDVICAERWLSTHAAVTPSGWIFVGPDSDAPDPAVGYKPGMSGWSDFIVAETPGDPSTAQLFHSTAGLRNWILSQRSVDE